MLETITYKNYKTLCEALGWMVTTGCSKQSQISLLKDICDYEKKGNKFIIKEVYIKDIEEIQMLLAIKESKERMYDREVEKNIISILKNHYKSLDTERDGGSYYTTRLDLAEQLGMFNINYQTGRLSKQKVSELLDLEKRVVFDFYNSAESLITRTIERVGKILKKLDSTRMFMINQVFIGTWYDKISKESYKHKLDENETSDVLESQAKALELLQLTSIKDVFTKEKFDEFYNATNNFMKEKYENYVSCFRAYEIIYCKTGLDRMEKLLNSRGMNVLKEANQCIAEELNLLAEKRHEISIKDSTNSWGLVKKIDLPEKNKIRNKEKYISDTQKLNEVFILKEAKDIRNNLK